jgi:hypothetical protein
MAKAAVLWFDSSTGEEDEAITEADPSFRFNSLEMRMKMNQITGWFNSFLPLLCVLLF